MKRSPSLKRLSREHHAALVLARACERAARSDNDDEVAAACARALFEYAAQIETHFEREEQNLLPPLQGDAVQAWCNARLPTTARCAVFSTAYTRTTRRRSPISEKPSPPMCASRSANSSRQSNVQCNAHN